MLHDVLAGHAGAVAAQSESSALTIAVISALVAGALALGGVLVGGLLEGRRQRRAFERQKKWERTRLRAEKLELIATTANEVAATIKPWLGHLASYLLIKDGEKLDDDTKVTGYKMLDERRKELKSMPVPHLEMLVALYAPELSEEMAALLDERDAMGVPMATVIGGETRDDRVGGFARFYPALVKFDKSCTALVEAAVKVAREEIGFDAKSS